MSIDGPRNRATVPSLPALTTPTAVFRLHGRSFEGYREDELEESRAPPVGSTAKPTASISP